MAEAQVLEWRSIWPVYLTSLTLPIDDAIVLPSLWGYVESLGGNARTYGAILVVYYAMRFITMPLVGVLVGKFRYKQVLLPLILLGMVASTLYVMAPVCGGVAAVAVSRAFLGVSSAATVGTMAYIAEYVPPEAHTQAYAINFGLQRACIPLAPLLNLLLVNLPVVSDSWVVLNKYSWAGVMIFTLNAAIFCILQTLREPERCRASHAEPALRLGEACTTLRESGAYFSFVISFQNNWTNQVVLWTIPIITSQLYLDLGVVGNSVLFACGGVSGLLTVLIVPKMTSGCSLRVVLLAAQLGVGLTLIPFFIVYGCGSGSSTSSTSQGYPGVWFLFTAFALYNVPFMAQMPVNNAIYNQLVGSRGKGVYMSFLECSKAMARICSGELIGVAFSSFGSCSLWSLTIAIWVLQFAPFLGNWRRLQAAGAREHRGMAAPLTDVAQAPVEENQTT